MGHGMTRLFIPEQSWVLQYLIPAGRSKYLHFDDSRRMFSLTSGSRHLIIRRWMPDPQFLLHYGMRNCREEKMVSIDKGESENLIKLTSVHSDECHFGLQSFISSGLQSSNVAGFAFKSQSLSSAKPSFLMHTTVRDLDALKQSPEHNVHGPINQSP